MNFYSHGKVLLTGEYAVLDGVKALALPTQKGQKMTIEFGQDEKITWESYDENGQKWIDCSFDLALRCLTVKTGTERIIQQLRNILMVLQKLSPSFYKNGVLVKTYLEFDRDWGLGSSSTLINNLAQWCKVNAYQLLEMTMGGSGYDIAVAQSPSALFYKRNGFDPIIEPVQFKPSFSDRIFFVHLKEKQNSRSAISSFVKKNQLNFQRKKRLEEIGEEILTSKSQKKFDVLLSEHEAILGKVLEKTPIQKRLFPSFNGQIKSLGAWGGDFVMVSGDENSPSYFINKGYNTVIPYKQFILI